MRVAILRIEGTNCEDETERAFREAGALPEKIHLNQLTGHAPLEMRRTLEDYDVLMFPGGFSAGDYVRAGALFGARLRASLGREIRDFVEDGRPVLGVCNGFQVLIELGLLPGFEEVMSPRPTAVLAPNDSGRFECRPTFLRYSGASTPFTGGLEPEDVIYAPSAHAEGKLILEDNSLDRLFENGQVVFTYVDPDGEPGGFPWNPNGSPRDVAGICNPAGNVLGMMPHPERSVHRHLHPEGWRGVRDDEWGDGFRLFRSVVDALGG
ncbi:MAG TPA: phosphoribosylformylglycinamidine synthase subunit PurQ [Thermoplasmata archaeon]|nr:phosphoribosylformylglycinamidine synthase subunit PurQ [Thermoplasmata archaeon]